MRVRCEVEPRDEQASASAEQRYTEASSFLRPLSDGDMVRVNSAPISMPPMELHNIPANPEDNPQATVFILHTQITQLQELYQQAHRTELGSPAWQRFSERRAQLDEQVARVTELLVPLNLILTPSPERLRQLLDKIPLGEWNGSSGI